MNNNIVVEVAHVLLSVIGAIGAIYAYKAKKIASEIHIAINGRLDEFLKLTAKASYAQGVKSETDKKDTMETTTLTKITETTQK